MNLEVVKLRARPGADAAGVAPFAEPAAEQVDETARYTAALLALVRAARGTTDAARIASDVVTLLAPSAARDGMRLELHGARSCLVGADALAVRLAVVSALLGVLAREHSPDPMDGVAGAVPANDPLRVIRCTTTSEPRPMLVIAPWGDAQIASSVQSALDDVGIAFVREADTLCLALPALQAS